MAVKLEPKPAAGKTGPKRTKVHPTKPGAMSQTQADIGDKFIAGGLASLKYENPGGYAAVKKAVGPTLGPEGMAAWEGEVASRVAKAQQKPPKSKRNVPSELMTKVLITRIAQGLNMDPKKVDPVAQEGYEVKGAPATFSEGQLRYNSDKVDPQTGQGKEVIAHEVVHAVQAAGQGKKDATAAEAEAQQIANLAALNQPLPQPKMGLPAGEVATYTVFGAGPPDQVLLNLAGQEYVVPTPGTTERDITVPAPSSPIPGLSLTQVKLKFDTEWALEEGVLHGTIQTPWLTRNAVELLVNKGGGVQIEVLDADLPVGDLATGTMDVAVTAEGVTGDARVEFGALNIGMGLSLAAGYIDFHHTPDQKIKGLGTVTGTAEGVGDFVLGAVVEGSAVTGRIGMKTTQPVDLGSGVQMTQAAVSADFNQSSFRLKGGAHVKVSDWAEGDLAAEMTYPGGAWTVVGTVNQVGGERAFGELSVSGATLGLKVNEGALEEVKGQGHFKVPHFEGNLGGTYDIGGDAFTGGGSVTLTEPMEMGEGTTLRKVDGDIKVDANTLVETNAKMEATFSYEGEPTFDAELEGQYLFQEQKFSGEGRIVTVRDVTLGPSDAYHAVVAAGAEASLKATDSLVEKAEATWEFTLNDSNGEVAKGSADISYDGQSFSGTGTFTLTTDVGFADRATGPIMLLTGTTVSLEFADSVITQISIGSAGFHIKSGSGQGEVAGEASGVLDPGVSVTSLEGSGQQQSPATFLNDKVTVIATGMSARIENDVLTEAAGSVSLEVDAVGGLMGSADFKWNKLPGNDDYEFDGVIDYQITEDIGGTVDVIYSGGVLSVEGTTIDGVEKLDEVAELVKRAVETIAVTAMIPPFTLELLPAYLAYRIWVLEDLDLAQIQGEMRELWAEVGGGFSFMLEFLPEWLKQAWSWVESGSPNLLNDMGAWLSENLKALGQPAIDWLLDMGEWGANTIRGAGAWAIEAAGWAMDAISDAGEAMATAAEAGWDWLTS